MRQRDTSSVWTAQPRSESLPKLDALAEHPTEAGSKPLQGYQGRAARIGGLRLIYRFDDTRLYVLRIAPRGQVYRNLPE